MAVDGRRPDEAKPVASRRRDRWCRAPHV